MKLSHKVLSVCLVSLGMVSLMSPTASAHGYIKEPASRAYLGTSAGGNLNNNVGRAQWEPQSIEAPKNTFIDGKIASAGVSGFSPLDEQTEMRWHKNEITNGSLNINWFLTARHRTSTWDYYITKKGWNPNKPLTFDDFELITQFDDKSMIPPTLVSQNIQIPNTHKGYHIILSVWNVADTTNAFYQVVDVDIQ